MGLVRQGDGISTGPFGNAHRPRGSKGSPLGKSLGSRGRSRLCAPPSREAQFTADIGDIRGLIIHQGRCHLDGLAFDRASLGCDACSSAGGDVGGCSKIFDSEVIDREIVSRLSSLDVVKANPVGAASTNIEFFNEVRGPLRLGKERRIEIVRADSVSSRRIVCGDPVV